MRTLIDFILHIDAHLLELASQYGQWLYGILFLIVFAETGFVVTPFLPGDSLLFAAGALAATPSADGAGTILRVEIVTALMLAAAILGDAVNYAIGNYVGPKVFSATDDTGWTHKLLNRRHLAQAHAFFEKYGGKAIVFGRFVPIVRTFVPFVAGAGSMTYSTFAFYNVAGAVLWVGVCVGLGYLFGNIPIVKQNFSAVMLAIIVVSILPAVYEVIKHRRAAK